MTRTLCLYNRPDQPEVRVHYQDVEAETPDPWYPGRPAYVLIERVDDLAGNEVAVTEAEDAMLADCIWDAKVMEEQW